jgi:hypothetical protein
MMLYFKILSRVINAAKRLHYDRLIVNSDNKMKTTWNIVKSLTGKSSVSTYKCALSENQQLIADSFQNYFLSIAEKIVSIIMRN